MLSQADGHCSSCCYVHRYAKLKRETGNKSHLTRNCDHLDVRSSPEDHATLRSAPARDTHVKITTAIQELAVRKAIVAQVYIRNCIEIYLEVERLPETSTEVFCMVAAGFCSSLALRTTSSPFALASVRSLRMASDGFT